MFQALAKIVVAIRADVLNGSHLPVTLRLSALLLVVHGASSSGFSAALNILGGSLLAFPGLIKNGTVWGLVAFTVTVGNALQWHAIDNHKYLITYWVWTCALVMNHERAAERLALTARLLIAVAFSLAVAWKVAGGEFLDGDFFYATFFIDERLQRFTSIVSGTPSLELSLQHAALGFISKYGTEGAEVLLPGSKALAWAALAMSWFGVLIELTIAVLHMGNGTRLYIARHVSLILFIMFTYVILPVLPFGFILAILGFVQCRDGDVGLKAAYLIVLAWIHVAALPWRW